MIKAIIFDMGMVLVEYDSTNVIKSKTNDPKVIEKINELVFKSPLWLQLDQGTITEEQILDSICDQLSKQEYEIAHYSLYNWPKYNLINKPLINDLLKKLHDDNYQLFVLSNAPALTNDYKDLIIPCPSYFKQMYFSGCYKMFKPQAQFFNLLLDQHHLNPDECCFLDDLSKNIEAAKELGIHTFQVNNNEDQIYEWIANLNKESEK